MSAATTAPAPDRTWVERYHRALLDFLEAPADIDLATVSTTSTWEGAWSYSEYTGGGAQFGLLVTWRSACPRTSYDKPGPDGLFTHDSELTNEDVARFLNSIV